MFEYLLKTIIYFLIMYLVGLGSAVYFRPYLKWSSIILNITYSLSFGLLISTFVLLSLGMLGFEVLGRNYYVIIAVLVIISLGYTLVKTVKTTGIARVKFSYIHFWEKEMSIYDKFFLLFLLILFAGVYISNSKLYLYQTDELRYWLIDARIIFETSALRDDNRIISSIGYSSFMPIQFAQIYFLFGRIVEQYSSVVTILYLFLGSVILYVQSTKVNLETKIFKSILVLLVSFIFIDQVFFAYADITLAFYVLLSVLAIRIKFPKSVYSKKILLLSVLILATSFIKLPRLFYSPYSIILLLTWILYDFRVIKEYILNKHFLRDKDLISLILPLGIIFSLWYYNNFIFTDTLNFKGDLVSPFGVIEQLFQWENLKKLLSYPSFFLKSFWDLHKSLLFFFIILWISSLINLIYSLRRKGTKELFRGKDFLLLFAITFIFPMMNIGFYAIAHRVTQLERYLTVSVFVGVLLYIYLYRTELWDKLKSVRYSILAIFSLLLVLQIYNSLFNPAAIIVSDVTGGSYRDFVRFEKEVRITDDVRSIVGDDDLVIAWYQIHCYDKNTDCVQNVSNNVNFYKYFLQDKQIGTTFSERIEDFPAYFNSTGAEYLLVFPGFGFTEAYGTDGDKNQFIHLYKFDEDEQMFDYIKGYEEFVYDG